MKSVTHVAIGALTYTNYLMLSGNKIDILDIPIVLTFSVLPDIDISSSKISSEKDIAKLNNISHSRSDQTSRQSNSLESAIQILCPDPFSPASPFYDFLSQRLVSPRTFGKTIIHPDRRAMAGRFCQADITRNSSLKNLIRKILLYLIINLAG